MPNYSIYYMQGASVVEEEKKEKTSDTISDSAECYKLLSPVKTRVWYRMHESELKNGLYHADNARAHMCLTCGVLPQGKHLKFLENCI